MQNHLDWRSSNMAEMLGTVSIIASRKHSLFIHVVKKKAITYPMSIIKLFLCLPLSSQERMLWSNDFSFKKGLTDYIFDKCVSRWSVFWTKRFRTGEETVSNLQWVRGIPSSSLWYSDIHSKKIRLDQHAKEAKGRWVLCVALLQAAQNKLSKLGDKAGIGSIPTWRMIRF